MPTTSLSLLVRLREPHDESGAWLRFTQLYTPLLFFWAKRFDLSSPDADDFVQDLLLHLLGKLSRFEHRGSGSFRAWLRIVATNKARERCRRKIISAVDDVSGNLREIADDVEEDPFWETEYRQRLVARALEIMQSEFEPTTWQACWQRTVDGIPAAEVARNLGLSEAAVYVYTGRVLRRLREELQDLLE